MTKREILKLIDENPYWGEDAESEVMIKDLKKWFEFNLKEIDDKETSKDDDSCEFVTKKEFKFEINRLWNEVRQVNSKLIINAPIKDWPYTSHGTSNEGYPFLDETSIIC